MRSFVFALCLLVGLFMSTACFVPRVSAQEADDGSQEQTGATQGRGISGEMVQLEPVRVVGSEILYEGYQTREITGALGIPADPMSVPISVSTITPQMISDIGAVRMEDTLDFVSGVSRQNEFGGLWDNYSIRGFMGDINRGPVFVRDGVRANRGYTGKQDAANLDRVEVLKGSSSALFGRSDPGGTVNIITKRPKFDFEGEVTFSASDNHPYRTTFDITGPLRDDIAARLNFATEFGKTFRDQIDEERYLVAPALTWEIDSRTRLHYDGEFVRQDRPLDRGIVAIDNDPGVLPISRFLGEPNDGTITLDTAANRFRFQRELNDSWSAQLTFAHMHSTLKGYSTESSGMIDDRLLRRERRFRDYSSDDIVGVGEVRGRTEIASMRHDFLFGTELSYYEQDFLMRRTNPSVDPFVIDVFDPVYGQEPPDFALARQTNRKDKEKTVAVYAQDLIHLTDRLRLLAGIRFDHFEQTLDNYMTGRKTKQTDNAFSPRVGLSFDLLPQVTLYGNAARTFDPNSGADRQGNHFDPEISTSFDLGVKTLLFGERIGIDAAIFHIKKENVLTTDPVDRSFSVTAGEVKSQGFELDINGKITDQWRVSLGYSYVDAKIQADGISFTENTPLLNVPSHSFSLLTNYEHQLGEGQVAGLGGGVVHVSSRLGNQDDTSFHLPAYTTVQARVYYQPVPHFDISLQVHNLLDEKYYRSSYFQNWVAPGAPRTVTAQLRYRF